MFSICGSVLIVIWGHPDQWSGCAQYYTSDWDDCMVECENDDTCIFTYLNSSICYLCQVGQINSIRDGKDLQLDKVAFKANVSSCSVSIATEYTTSEYTVLLHDGFWNFSYLSSTQKLLTKSVLDTSTRSTIGSTVKVTTKTTTKPTTTTLKTTKTTKTSTSTTTKKVTTPTIIGWSCPSGWNYFSRQLGKWCMQVFAGTVTQTTAASNCVNKGGVLSGPENTAEQAYIISEGVGIILSLSGSIRQGSLWVGAARLTTCRGTNTNAASCLPWANNAYQWTDGFTSLKNMMVWITNQPDYSLNAESCVQMAIVNRTDGSGGAVSGQLNDCQCQISTSTVNLNYIRGYVCGLKATAIYG